MRVILAGGGTGGHLYPGIAVAEELELTKTKSFFMVSNRGIERMILDKYSYRYLEQDVSPFARVGFISKLSALSKAMLQVIKNLRYISRKDKILLLGGFVSVPVALAALIKGADIYIHEQNSIMGRANRLLAPFAKKIFVSYETSNYKNKSVYSGNPVRKTFENFDVKSNLDKTIFVSGGSQGSRFINNLVVEVAEQLLKDGYTIYHQAGANLIKETSDRYGELLKKYPNNIHLFDYSDNITEIYKKADVVIARSGSGTVYETLYSKRPAIFIPFAYAVDNHQYHNALLSGSKGIAFVLEEAEANSQKLLETMDTIYRRYELIKASLRDVEFVDSAKVIVHEMGIK